MTIVVVNLSGEILTVANTFYMMSNFWRTFPGQSLKEANTFFILRVRSVKETETVHMMSNLL